MVIFTFGDTNITIVSHYQSEMIEIMSKRGLSYTVDEIFESLIPGGDPVQIIDRSLSYIRNRQHLYNKTNPDKHIRVLSGGFVRRVK